MQLNFFNIISSHIIFYSILTKSNLFILFIYFRLFLFCFVFKLAVSLPVWMRRCFFIRSIVNSTCIYTLHKKRIIKS